MSRHKRLAAIMFTDMVGFSRLTHENPMMARELNEEHQQIVREHLKKFDGYERQSTGDGFFIEFNSASQALKCAVEIQQSLNDRNLTRSTGNQVQIRIGLHLGDIHEKDQEIFGDSVNIAARLEPLALPGGICLSKQFYELAKADWSENKFSSLGLHHLKNIAVPVEILKFNFTWDVERKSFLSNVNRFTKRFIFKRSHWAMMALFSLSFIFLVMIVTKAFLPQFQKSAKPTRIPSSVQAMEFSAEMSSGWSYSTDHSQWHEYLPKKSWMYPDKIVGNYELKKEFTLAEKPSEPALILGLIPESHRVFLNEKYIGGSNQYSDLAMYSFDPGLLRLSPEKNIIFIKAESRPTLNPGLVLLSEFEPKLGELSEIKSIHSRYYFKQFVVKNVFFVFSLIVFLLSLIYATYLKNKDEIFYSCLFLLLGCLHFSYYNPWVNSTFDYQFLRSLRLNSILVSSLILISGYLSSRKKERFCIWNNILALITSWSIFLVFNLYSFQSAENFVSLYNWSLLGGLLYVGSFVSNAIFKEFINRKELRIQGANRQAYFYLFFAVISLFNYLGAFKNGKSELIFDGTVRNIFLDIGLGSIFIFAVSRITMALFDYAQKNRLELANAKKDDFFKELTQIVSQLIFSDEKVRKIQKLTSLHLKAEISTLYLVNGSQEKMDLFSSTGQKNNFDPSKALTEGVFGYVLANRRALLIEDINQDSRFLSERKSQFDDYKSGTCMLFPLLVDSEVLGVLTFADKENKRLFTSHDFENGLKVCSFVSLLIASQKNRFKIAG